MSWREVRVEDQEVVHEIYVWTDELGRLHEELCQRYAMDERNRRKVLQRCKAVEACLDFAAKRRGGVFRMPDIPLIVRRAKIFLTGLCYRWGAW